MTYFYVRALFMNYKVRKFLLNIIKMCLWERKNNHLKYFINSLDFIIVYFIVFFWVIYFNFYLKVNNI